MDRQRTLLNSVTNTIIPLPPQNIPLILIVFDDSRFYGSIIKTHKFFKESLGTCKA